MSTVPLPPVEQLEPGLWSLPVPIPIRPLRYVLVYALDTPEGIVLIDAGWDTPEAWEHLTGGLAHLGASPADVRGVLVTHIHPDHYGLAGRVREASDAWIALHPADAALLDDEALQVDALLAETLAWARRTGAPTRELETISPEVLPLHPFSKVAAPDVLLEHGRRAPVEGWNLHAVHTPGHSPGHLCFHDPDRQVLFTGGYDSLKWPRRDGLKWPHPRSRSLRSVTSHSDGRRRNECRGWRSSNVFVVTTSRKG